MSSGTCKYWEVNTEYRHCELTLQDVFRVKLVLQDWYGRPTNTHTLEQSFDIGMPIKVQEDQLCRITHAEFLPIIMKHEKEQLESRDSYGIVLGHESLKATTTGTRGVAIGSGPTKFELGSKPNKFDLPFTVAKPEDFT